MKKLLTATILATTIGTATAAPVMKTLPETCITIGSRKQTVKKRVEND